MRRRNEKRTTLWYGQPMSTVFKIFQILFWPSWAQLFLRAPLSSVREESLRFTVCLVSFGYTGELTDCYWARDKLKIKIMRFANSANWDFKAFSLTLKGSYTTETSLFTTFYDSLLIFRVCHSVSYPFYCKCQSYQTNFPFTLYLIHLVALKTIHPNSPPPLPPP